MVFLLRFLRGEASYKGGLDQLRSLASLAAITVLRLTNNEHYQSTVHKIEHKLLGFYTTVDISRGFWFERGIDRSNKDILFDEEIKHC
jgi:hypothetical protein